MSSERCAERLQLSIPVVNAIAQVYTAKTAHDTAKLRHAANVDALADALRAAMEAERAAERAYDDHVRQHGCAA